MNTVFADTNYWVALQHPDENLRAKAVLVSRQLGPRPILTSEWVFLEVLNYFSHRGPWHREWAATLCRGIRRNPQVEVLPANSADFDQALEFFHRHKDKSWSIVDCLSFLAMQQRGLTQALPRA